MVTASASALGPADVSHERLELEDLRPQAAHDAREDPANLRLVVQRTCGNTAGTK